jgi:hypothetical protein
MNRQSNRKRIVIIAAVAICVAVLAAVTLYRPKRIIVIEVDGPAECNVDAVLVVDGQRHTETVTLPRTFEVYARDVSYRVDPVDPDAGIELTGRIYTSDGFADGSSTGPSVGASVSCSNVLGIWLGGIVVMTYDRDTPGPEVTTR